MSAPGPIRVFVTGDSHTSALYRGQLRLERRKSLPADVAFTIKPLGSGARMIRPFFRDGGDHVEITDQEYRERVPRLPRHEGSGEMVCWSGLFHFAKVWRDATWSDHRPAPVPGPERPLSTGMLRSVLLAWFGSQLALIDALRAHRVPVIAVEAPAPFRHHPALQRTRAEVVVAVHRMCRQAMLEELSRRSIPLASVPAELMDEEGFMLPGLRSPNERDPHHGNQVFGAAMLERIAACARELRDAAGSP